MISSCDQIPASHLIKNLTKSIQKPNGKMCKFSPNQEICPPSGQKRKSTLFYQKVKKCLKSQNFQLFFLPWEVESYSNLIDFSNIILVKPQCKIPYEYCTKVIDYTKTYLRAHLMTKKCTDFQTNQTAISAKKLKSCDLTSL